MEEVRLSDYPSGWEKAKELIDKPTDQEKEQFLLKMIRSLYMV